MKKRLMLGDNRTGLSRVPAMREAMLQGTEEFKPTSRGDGSMIVSIHEAYARASGVLGSVPRPEDGRGELDEMYVLLLDKVGARLAFERAGTRLWEAVIEHFDNDETLAGRVRRSDLEEIRAQELEHFEMLQEVIEMLRGDATAVTPSADLEAVLGQGVGAVLGDPRISFSQALEAILVAELLDHDQWEILVDLARNLGETSLEERFRRALAEEDAHLEKVRIWLSVAQNRFV